MERDEAIAIIRKEYLCVDRDCDIEKKCGKCDLVMPSKEPILEAFKMAIKALEQEPCGDAISRQAAIDAIEKWFHSDDTREPAKVLRCLPLAQPERHGRWFVEEKDSIYGKKYILTCSECGDIYAVSGAALLYEKYCRNCGSRNRR